MNRDEIKKIALDRGFKLEDQPNGKKDFDESFYYFAEVIANRSQVICQGHNCHAIDGEGHSLECEDEHNEVYAEKPVDPYDTPGNRNPDARYAGYKGRPLLRNYTLDERMAHEEGVKAAN